MDRLFNLSDLSNKFEKEKNKILLTIESYPIEIIQNNSIDEIALTTINKSNLKAPKLRPDQAGIIYKSEIKIPKNDYGQNIEVPGIAIIVSIPFEGNAEYFRWRPSTYTPSLPQGKLTDNEIRITHIFSKGEEYDIQSKHKQYLDKINQYLSWVERDIDTFITSIKGLIEEKIRKRKEAIAEMHQKVKEIGLPENIKSQKTSENILQNIPKGTISRKIEYDAFISHASEDKNFVRPLAEGLQANGLKIWYDEFTLEVGNSLRESIDFGLTNSKYGIVVFSKFFFEKRWTKYELNGLVTKELDGYKVILPIWHNVTRDEVAEYSPSLADKVALVNTNTNLNEIIKDLVKIIKD